MNDQTDKYDEEKKRCTKENDEMNARETKKQKHSHWSPNMKAKNTFDHLTVVGVCVSMIANVRVYRNGMEENGV